MNITNTLICLLTQTWIRIKRKSPISFRQSQREQSRNSISNRLEREKIKERDRRLEEAENIKLRLMEENRQLRSEKMKNVSFDKKENARKMTENNRVLRGKVSHRKEVPSKSAVKDHNGSRIQEQPQSSPEVKSKLGARPVQGQNLEHREPQESNQKGSSALSQFR